MRFISLYTNRYFLSFFLSVVRSKLRRMPPMEMGLLKPQEREGDSEDEVL